MRNLALFLIIIIVSCKVGYSSTPEYKVLINGNLQCKYDYGDENFCSKSNLDFYKKAKKTINFDSNKSLIAPSDNFGYIIIIDPSEKAIYPLNYLVDYSHISFSKNSDIFCINGTISAYRDEDSGFICFKFQEDGFKRIY